MVLITDKKKPLAIAGIMGGEESQVTEATHNVLLESAYFTPFSIRKTAKSLNLSTEASCRFERRVNSAGVVSALNRATYLIENGSKGKIGKLVQAKACDYQVGVGFIRPVQGLETFPTKNKLWEASPDADILGLMNQASTISKASFATT